MKNRSHRALSQNEGHFISRRQFLIRSLLGAAGFVAAEMASPLLKSKAASGVLVDPAPSLARLTHNSAPAGAYLARPAGRGSFPGVIVLQDWWGVDESVKLSADRLAAAGFLADLQSPSSATLGQRVGGRSGPSRQRRGPGARPPAWSGSRRLANGRPAAVRGALPGRVVSPGAAPGRGGLRGDEICSQSPTGRGASHLDERLPGGGTRAKHRIPHRGIADGRRYRGE